MSVGRRKKPLQVQYDDIDNINKNKSNTLENLLYQCYLCYNFFTLIVIESCFVTSIRCSNFRVQLGELRYVVTY